MYSRFELHELVVITHAIFVKECCVTISAGETGTILDIDPDLGSLVLRLQLHHPELQSRSNIIEIKSPHNQIRRARTGILPRSIAASSPFVAAAALLLALSFLSLHKLSAATNNGGAAETANCHMAPQNQILHLTALDRG